MAASRKVRRSRTSWVLALSRSSGLAAMAFSTLASATGQAERAGLVTPRVPRKARTTGVARMGLILLLPDAEPTAASPVPFRSDRSTLSGMVNASLTVAALDTCAHSAPILLRLSEVRLNTTDRRSRYCRPAPVSRRVALAPAGADQPSWGNDFRATTQWPGRAAGTQF